MLLGVGESVVVWWGYLPMLLLLVGPTYLWTFLTAAGTQIVLGFITPSMIGIRVSCVGQARPLMLAESGGKQPLWPNTIL